MTSGDVITQIAALTHNQTRHVCLWWRVNDRALLKSLKVKCLSAGKGSHCAQTQENRVRGFLFYTEGEKSVHCKVNSEDYSWS